MFQIENNPGRTTMIAQKEYLFFSGYAYLGLQHNDQFKQLVFEGLEKYGWLFPSSRISNTQHIIFEQFEALLSSITNSKYSFSFSSGFSAGTVASSLFEGHKIFVCPEAHPAINKTHQIPLIFDKWAEQTLHFLHENNYATTPVLLADSVNPVTGEVNDFDFLQYTSKPIIVVIDDSHGIGLLGNNGEGIRGLLPKKDHIEYVFTYSLSKAFGINGGAISCNDIDLANTIKTSPEFTASTPISPALAYAFINAQNVYSTQRDNLIKNVSFLRNLLASNSSVVNDESLPFFILPEHLDEDFFKSHEIIISSFAYPNPTGRKINRAVLNALHTQNDLTNLANTIIKA